MQYITQVLNLHLEHSVIDESESIYSITAESQVMMLNHCKTFNKTEQDYFLLGVLPIRGICRSCL